MQFIDEGFCVFPVGGDGHFVDGVIPVFVGGGDVFPVDIFDLP